MNQKYQRRSKPCKTSEEPLFGNFLPIMEHCLKENGSKTKSRPKTERHFDPTYRNPSIRSKDESTLLSAVVTLLSFVMGLVVHAIRLRLGSKQTGSKLNQQMRENCDAAVKSHLLNIISDFSQTKFLMMIFIKSIT